jgi:hypothetical protein
MKKVSWASHRIGGSDPTAMELAGKAPSSANGSYMAEL